MRHFYFIFFATIFTFTSLDTFAQISASETEGCAPLASVVFTSSFSNPTNILWDFDDGATSNLASPVNSFANPGVYTVSYTATSGGSSVNANITITVYANPNVDFIISPEEGVCLGESIQLIDASTGGSGSSITNLQWDFGDGAQGASGSTVNHTYTNSGIYTITLIATDGNGCVSSINQPGAVAISEPPTINITTNPSPAVACEAPLDVSFTNTSTSNSPTGSTLAHSWNFGNGGTSTQQTPGTTTYTTEGTYTITYIATDNIGCSATQTIPVSVQEPMAQINVLGLTNGVSCGDVEFQIVGTQGGFFNYGDGFTGFSLFHTYNNEGTYTVTYSINVAGCSAEATTTVSIEVPTAEIISNPGFACFKPADFTYSVSSDYTIDSYNWTFPGNATSTAISPANALDYNEPGEYDRNGLELFLTSLVFTTINGCTGTATIIDSLALPNALFYPDVTQGCAPLVSTFKDESAYFIEGNIEEWEWHFGDGTVITETETADQSHTYTNPGEYEAYLIITTDEGCIDTSFTHIIEVGEPIEPTFTLPATVCHSESVEVTNTSVNDELIEAYSYSGDGFTLDNCINEEAPFLIFDDVTGVQTVTQFAEYNGCVDSYTQNITVLGPVGKLNYECNCGTPLDYAFSANTSDAEYWTWDLGDGTVIENSTDEFLNHSYAESGDYEVILTSFSDATGCLPYVDSNIIKVRQLNAGLNIQQLACVGEVVSLSASTSVDVALSNGCKRNYLWYFNDGSRPIKTTLPTTNHAFPAGGDYTTQLFVEDINGCVDSTSSLIRVFDITAAYEADTLFGCPPLEVNFTDLTESDTTIVTWNWIFDDGNTSLDQDPTNIYTNIDYDFNNIPIPFNISLTVTDILGCTSTIDDLVITPLGPNPDFEATSQANICAGDLVTFIPTASNVNSHTYNWEYGNDSLSVGANGESVFTNAGLYDITLTVTDEFGCARTLTQPLVDVQAYPIPIIDPSYEEDEVLCYPVIISFTDASIADVFGSRTWELNMGGPTLGIPTVQTTFQNPGLYDIDLEVTTTYGCTRDTTIVVEVEGPVAEIVLNPDAICPGGSIELNLADTADLATWQFDLGDGNIATNLWPAFHDYASSFIPSSGQTLITLVMYSEDSVCSAARTAELIIEEVIADFDRNNETTLLDSIHCFGTPDLFSNTSTPNAVDFLWTISNGSSYTTQEPPNLNLAPGEYTINLMVESALGCRDTVEKYMRIYPLPIAEVNSGAICQGEDILLTATGGISYSWQPAGSIDNPNSNIVFATPATSTEYTVLVTDTNDCTAAAFADVHVFQPTVSIQVDTVLRIGDSDFAGFDLGGAYTYQWSPNFELECDTCAATIFTPLEDRLYTLTISDTVGCFSTESYFYFDILEVAEVDLPDAFTPNGDGINDKVFVKGWGIENLLSFSIYNRWGEQVFQTGNITEGWDGSYKGEIQSQDSYAYIVIVKSYIYGEPTTIKGFIDLIK